ncbi:hypothetical protein D1823_12940 [Ruegeria sp. AD91A]|uniref:hypothetical protein n=1 Tax=Ruegeria sp. AD91A TaxID=2293862 RepID=UPI000E4BA151|nr:hypothetical protein [Ruegeria sp. AD91A]AXT27406.1 hypothetical protein D1823_12940 [Ruegeria sp. AD91A]
MTNRLDVKSTWDSVMNETKNPLKNQSLPTAHLLMQMLAWMWSAIFSLMVGSYFVFGVTAAAHTMLIGGVFMTLLVFQKSEAASSDLR